MYCVVLVGSCRPSFTIKGRQDSTCYYHTALTIDGEWRYNSLEVMSVLRLSRHLEGGLQSLNDNVKTASRFNAHRHYLEHSLLPDVRLIAHSILRKLHTTQNSLWSETAPLRRIEAWRYKPNILKLCNRFWYDQENNNWYPTQKRLGEPHTRCWRWLRKNNFLLKQFSLLFCNFLFYCSKNNSTASNLRYFSR